MTDADLDADLVCRIKDATLAVRDLDARIADLDARRRAALAERRERTKERERLLAELADPVPMPLFEGENACPSPTPNVSTDSFTGETRTGINAGGTAGTATLDQHVRAQTATEPDALRYAPGSPNHAPNAMVADSCSALAPEAPKDEPHLSSPLPPTLVDVYHGRTEHKKATPEETAFVERRTLAYDCPMCKASAGAPCDLDSAGKPIYHVGRGRRAGIQDRIEEVETTPAVDPLLIVCPDCAAEAGQHCTNSAGTTLAHVHRQRNADARKACQVAGDQVQTPAVKPSDPIDLALRLALNLIPENRMRRAREEGETDGTIKGQLLAGYWGGGPDRATATPADLGGYWTRGGSRPGLWASDALATNDKGSHKKAAATFRKPDLEGKALIQRVREIARIPVPGVTHIRPDAVTVEAEPTLYAVWPEGQPRRKSPTYYIRARTPEQAQDCLAGQHPAGYRAKLIPAPLLIRAPKGFCTVDAAILARPPVPLYDAAEDEAARKAVEAMPAEGESHTEAFERNREAIRAASLVEKTRVVKAKRKPRKEVAR